jgi:hypothetical protein
MQILKQQNRLFKSALLAGGINANQNLFNGEDGRKSVHIEGGLCTLGRPHSKKTAPRWVRHCPEVDIVGLYIMRLGAL